jgi:MoaA/NifB/PqqE/SkfB family radical SAM enzyme
MSIPADHLTTAKKLGTLGMINMIAKAGFNYRHTMVYLLGKGQFRRLNNFLYTKTMVPTGEGSGELAYYAIGGILQKYPKLVPYPKYIEIEISTYCGFRCIFCEHTAWHQPSRNLSLADFIKLTDQFDLKWVNLTGEGDAFLNPDYLKMIKHLKHRNTSVFLVDSFNLINKDVARVLVESGVDGIYISMDGATKQTYESIKVGCDYDKVLTNIKNLLEIKKELKSPIPEICFRFVVNKKNINEMADYVKVINSIATRNAFGDGSKIHFVGLLDFPDIHDLYLDTIPIDRINETLEVVKKNPKSMPVVFAHTEQATNPSINKCLAWAEPYFALVPEPMMLPCCAVLMSNDREKSLRYSFGNYNSRPIREIWNSPYYKWFRSAVTNPTSKVPMLCAGCRAYDTTERMQKYGVDARTKEDFE